MKIARSVNIGLVMLGMLGGWPVAPAYADVIDRIVAILNEDLILLSEVREHAMQPAAQVVANLRTVTDPEDAPLHYMIERQLLAHEVQYLATPRETGLAKELALRYIVTAYHQQDRQAFSRAVQVAGISEAALEDELMLYMKGIDYIRRKYRFSEDIDNADRVFALFTNWLNELQDRATLQLVY